MLRDYIVVAMVGDYSIAGFLKEDLEDIEALAESFEDSDMPWYVELINSYGQLEHNIIMVKSIKYIRITKEEFSEESE